MYTEKDPKIYLAGDIMSLGSQHEMSLVEDICEELKIPYYSPRKCMSINDKHTQTEESNNTLAERIVKKDCDMLKEVSTVVFNLQQHALGTITELGYLLGLKHAGIVKNVFVVYHDIRRNNNLNEKNDRRSRSINQFVYGAILELTNNQGIITLEELKKELEKLS